MTYLSGITLIQVTFTFTDSNHIMNSTENRIQSNKSPDASNVHFSCKDKDELEDILKYSDPYEYVNEKHNCTFS